VNTLQKGTFAKVFTISFAYIQAEVGNKLPDERMSLE
jgi:hypothetical protein